MYSTTDKNSFASVKDLVVEARKNNIPQMWIIGTKTDRVNEREVSTEEGKALADSLGFPFFEISFKSHCNVQPITDCMLHDLWTLLVG